MTQSSKFIDVTRTYVPVDPNSFPISLHGASKEDSPENKIPVMAYKGYNFLPTSYGYKSYFGTSQEIGIDALTARVDKIFIYQNQGYENILIALTDSGVWTKKGEVAGAWVNSVPMATDVNPNVHYEWTAVIIADILYTYRQGQPSYQKYVHSSTTQLTITSIVPNFLNMIAQVGIFRAAGRLAFWDSADSTAWANLDDFSDFVPSLETMAGNIIHAEVQGRIVTILAHGAGFIIYATKSIVYIAENSGDIYQWKPTVISPNCGIAYPRQACIASPDTIHFAYTNEGLMRIERAQSAIIVPEVTDFLKDYDKPVYLSVLEGRYLFLEIIDPGYITGLIQLSDEVVEGIEYAFPGNSLDLEDYVIPDQGAQCVLLAGMDNGNFPDTLPPAPLDQHPTNKTMKALWTCYISRNGITDPANIVWGAGACPTVDPNGVEANMSPSGFTVDKMSQTSSHKEVVPASSAYVDGIWTMERFVQTQTAIWEAEERALDAYLATVTNRSKSVTKTSNSGACVPVALARSECTMGRYVSEFSPAKFGYSKCQFWLTRFAMSAIDLIRVKANITNCTDKRIALSNPQWYADLSNNAPTTGTVLYGSAQAAINALNPAFASTLYWDPWTVPYNPNTSAGNTISGQAGYARYIIGGAIHSGVYVKIAYRPNSGYGIATITAAAGPYPTLPTITQEPIAGRYQKDEIMHAYNKGVDVALSPVAVESPYCEIIGWEYTKVDGTKGTLPAGACSAPTIYPANNPSTKPGGTIPSVAKSDGSYCGGAFEGATIGGQNITWPSQTVAFPTGSFLLQLGSAAPVYPTMAGALVYDLQLKKWGKMKLNYKQLLDYSPINSTLNGVVPSNVFGVNAGALGTNGKITLFDARPSDSYISYGKVGYYRLGNTSPEEVIVHFRSGSTGQLKVETSLTGRNLGAGLVTTQDFTNATEVRLTGAYPGRWANIEISGIYDINYLEYRGFIQGRR